MLEDPPVEEPPLIPPVEDPPVVEPPVEDPPVVEPPVEDPPVVEPPVEEYPPEVVPPEPAAAVARGVGAGVFVWVKVDWPLGEGELPLLYV